jgi:DsbC/DsbD-like thiol-disulfide interchange protein
MKRRGFLKLAIAAMALPARAATPNYSVTLVSGGLVDGRWRAGVLVKLAPGWKTYWRVPGDAGVPPQFDWSHSDNVAHVEVSFPLPTRFRDAGGEAIGYHDEVLFPVAITPGAAERKVVLRLGMFFAVCRDICIPARAEAGLDLSATPPNSLVEMWRGRVPVPVKDGPVKTASFISDKAKRRTFLALKVDGNPDDIFIESKTSASFGKPEFDQQLGQFLLPISNPGKPDSLKKAKLKVTLAIGASGIEQAIIVP